MATDVKRKLELLRLSNAQARRLFDCFLTYKKNMGEMEVKLLSKKSGLSQKEIRNVLNVLEKHSLGRFIVGRRGGKSRFEWSEDYLNVIPGKQPGEPEDVDPLAAIAVKGVAGVASTPLSGWVIPLGGRRSATLLLPAAVQLADIERLREFCEEYISAIKAAT